MRLLHGLAKIHASFDDPNLVSQAGLVPLMALAQRAGLGDLVAEHVRISHRCGLNAQLKVPCLVAGMIAGADSAASRRSSSSSRLSRPSPAATRRISTTRSRSASDARTTGAASGP